MHPARRGVHRAGEDRAHEAGVVGEPLRQHPLVGDPKEGRLRAKRFGDRGQRAAVHEAERLLDPVLHRNPAAGALRGDLEDLDAERRVQGAVEADAEGRLGSHRLRLTFRPRCRPSISFRPSSGRSSSS